MQYSVLFEDCGLQQFREPLRHKLLVELSELIPKAESLFVNPFRLKQRISVRFFIFAWHLDVSHTLQIVMC